MSQHPPLRFYRSLARERRAAARACLRRWARATTAWGQYLVDARRYSSEMDSNESVLEAFPQVYDRTVTTPFDAHYVHQGPWVQRHLAARQPAVHVDVGSFVGYLGFYSSLVSTVFIDIRPPRLAMPGLSIAAGSLAGLPFRNGSIPSLSCLHVLEHVGLGRYGDPIDVRGTQSSARELVRVLAPGGNLYVALPVGRPKTYFNAHRVHDPAVIADLFTPLTLAEHAAVLDDGQLVTEPALRVLAEQNYACGLYHFTR